MTAHVVDISHLGPQQRELLEAVLRAGDVSFGIARNELVADEAAAHEVARALAWVVAPDREAFDEFDDPEFRSELPPVVRQAPAPLPDGRRRATRYRRLVGGLLDELLVGVPTGLAARAGASAAVVVAVHAFYFVVPTTVFGWSLGKLATRTRVVEAIRLRPPVAWRSTLRWLLPYLPVIVALTIGLSGDLIALAVALVYLPIMSDLRGWHDRAANTLVVNVRSRE